MCSNLMIVEAMSNGLVVRVVVIVVVAPVRPVVWIESGDAEGTEELLPRHHEGSPSVVGMEQLGRHGHRDGKVAPELVVAPRVAAVQGVFVNAGLVYQVCRKKGQQLVQMTRRKRLGESAAKQGLNIRYLVVVVFISDGEQIFQICINST